MRAVRILTLHDGRESYGMHDRIRLTGGFELVNGSEQAWKMETWAYPEIRKRELVGLESFQCTGTDKLLMAYANKAGYNDSILGSEKGLSVEQSVLEIVASTNGDYRKPIGIMIDNLKRVWAIDANTAIIQVLKYGRLLQLDNYDFYIIDLCKRLVVDYRNVLVEENNSSIEARIEICKTYQEYLDKGMRPISISYTVGDLMSRLTKYDLKGLHSYNYHYYK